jgi:hypothetical protein
VLISPLKRTWLFIWTNLNSFHPRIICTKFDWFWSAGSGEEDFSKFSLYFLLFRYYLPLEKGNPLLLKKIWIPFTQGQYVPSLVKIGPMVLEKISKWPHPIFTFCNYLPFEEDLALICTKFDLFWPAGSGEDF